MTERWLPVVGYEGYYEVSDQGRVRSLDRMVSGCRGTTQKAPGRVLKPRTDRGYVRFCLSRDDKKRTRMGHQLVAEAFIGPCPDGLEVCHDNGQRDDNRLENLRYDTHSANQMDSVRLGTHNMARRTHCQYGHEFTESNLNKSPSNKPNMRVCRECNRQRSKRYHASRRARRLANVASSDS